MVTEVETYLPAVDSIIDHGYGLIIYLQDHEGFSQCILGM